MSTKSVEVAAIVTAALRRQAENRRRRQSVQASLGRKVVAS
jgi:hypothetical protein